MTAARGPLCVIPARAGSKRVPRKNERLFGGKPLIVHTIEAAVASGVFSRIVVTTDGERLADIARRAGADVPFLRDPALADDHTPVSRATLDAIERLEREGGVSGAVVHESVAQLMPNCPLRTEADVRASHAAFLSSGAESQISVTRYDWRNPWWAMRRGADGRLEPIFAERATQRSQDLPEIFCPTGAVWWARVPALRREGTFHIEGRTGWEIDWMRAVDIDTEEDWEFAELLLARSGSGAHVG